MKDLVSLPPSVLEKLAELQQQGAQIQRADSTNVLAQALSSLAQASPDLCTLLMGAQLGFCELNSVLTESMTHVHRDEGHLCGFKIKESLRTETLERRVTKTHRFSK